MRAKTFKHLKANLFPLIRSLSFDDINWYQFMQQIAIEYITFRTETIEQAHIYTNGIICSSALLSPNLTLSIRAANLEASSLLHLWYPLNSFGSSCRYIKLYYN